MSHLSEHCFTSCLLRFSRLPFLLVRQHIKLLPNEVDEINFCIDFHCLLLDCFPFLSWRVGGSLIGIWGNKTIYRTESLSIKRQSMKLICSMHDRLARAGAFGSCNHRSTSVLHSVFDEISQGAHTRNTVNTQSNMQTNVSEVNQLPCICGRAQISINVDSLPGIFHFSLASVCGFLDARILIKPNPSRHSEYLNKNVSLTWYSKKPLQLTNTLARSSKPLTDQFPVISLLFDLTSSEKWILV